MTENGVKRILLAPLDWGLGHTTRCLPVIDHLVRCGHHVTIACNSTQKQFIAAACNDVNFVHLEGYNISYSARQKPSAFSNVLLLPHIYSAIKQEHSWLQQHIAELKPHAIISDNRYGFYAPKIPSAIITHQLMVQTGAGKTANHIMQRLHYRLLREFDAVWVPDVAGTPNLSGDLSHCRKLPPNTNYSGPLSQFTLAGNKFNNKGYLLVLLSGPEPQRGMFCKMLLQQLAKYKGPVVIVAGSENETTPLNMPGNIRFFKTLAGAQLRQVVGEADLVICRSGYTSIMDLVLLGRRAIFVPTPGQTEQEYLARHMQEQGLFPYVEQDSFELDAALERAAVFAYRQANLESRYNDFSSVIDKWISGV